MILNLVIKRILVIFENLHVISNISDDDNIVIWDAETIRKRQNRSNEYDFTRRLRRLGSALCLVLFTAVPPTLTFAQDVTDSDGMISISKLQFEQHYNGQRNSSWMSPVAILVSAFGSWLLIIISIKENRKIAQKRATFDYLYKLAWDKDYIEDRNVFLALKRGKHNVSKISEDYEKLKQKDKPETDGDAKLVKHHNAIKSILNEYEAIAVGISTETLSEEIILRNMRQTLADAIDFSSGFIDQTRKNSEFKEPDSLYCEVRLLVAKWRDDGKLPVNNK